MSNLLYARIGKLGAFYMVGLIDFCMVREALRSASKRNPKVILLLSKFKLLSEQYGY